MVDIYTDLGNLTEDTTFDEVWVSLSTGYVRYITAMNNGSPVARVEKAERSGHGPVDSTHDSYIVAMNAVLDGDVDVKYWFGSNVIPNRRYTAYAKDDIPARYLHLLQFDSFNVDVVALQQVVEDVAYGELTFYQYNDLPDPLPGVIPTFNDGDVPAMIFSMEEAGWYHTIADAVDNKGTATILRTAIVSYEYVGATDSSTLNVNIPPRDDVRYSVDEGETWTDDPPDDPDDTTHLELTVGGEVVDFPIKHDTGLADPVDRITDGLPPYVISASSPYVVSLSNRDLSLYHGIQILTWRAESWGDSRHKFGGFTPILPISQLIMTAPSLVGQNAFDGIENRIVGTRGYYHLIVHRDTGTVILRETFTASQSAYDTDDYTSFVIAFESYPKSELLSAITASALSMEFKGTKRGLSVGQKLFCENEEMLLTAIGDTTIAGGEVRTALTIGRGENGTTAVAHSADTVIRAVSTEDRLRNLLVFASSGLTRPHYIRVIGYKKPEEIT